MSKFTTVLIIAVLMSILFSSCNKQMYAQKKAKPVYYTCPMHTDIIVMQPGKCPRCGMALVVLDLEERIQRNSGSNYNPHNNSGGSSGGHSGGHH
jgi:hypothetical protein